jgi:glyoxylate utilization-related uncharacterized protein
VLALAHHPHEVVRPRAALADEGQDDEREGGEVWRDDEGFYVLEGELTLWVGNDEHVLRPGESVLAPRGVPHALRVGDRDARWLVTSTPTGFEGFVRAVGSTEPQAALPDPSELARVPAEHGIEILGPPGMLPAELQDRAA